MLRVYQNYKFQNIIALRALGFLCWDNAILVIENDFFLEKSSSLLPNMDQTNFKFIIIMTKENCTFPSPSGRNNISHVVKIHNFLKHLLLYFRVWALPRHQCIVNRVSDTKVLRLLRFVQWVRALHSQAEGWVFESQPRQTR